MKKLNDKQRLGFAILILGITILFLAKNSFFETLSGGIIAIGLGFILKWLPWRKQRSK